MALNDPQPSKDTLTDKQRAFVLEYLKDWNATQAAIRAGYSEDTARSIGHENLTKPDIRREIDLHLADMGITSDRVLAEQAAIAFGDMGDFLEISVRYFDGRDLLFRADSRLLDALITNAESQVGKMNAIAEKYEDNPLGLTAYILDIEAVKQDVLAHLDEHIKQEVDMVRSDVYRTNDNFDKAFSVIEEYAEAELARQAARITTP